MGPSTYWSPSALVNLTESLNASHTCTNTHMVALTHAHTHMLQWLFSHHIFRYVILWEAHSEWLSSKTPGCVYNKGDLLKQGWHWEPSGGGIYLESSRALAKLWSALVLYLPFLFLPTTDWPVNTATHRGWPWYPGNRAKPDSNSQLARGALSLTTLSLFHLPWNTYIWTMITFLMVGVVFGK